jgi:hypothetical protein
MCFNSENARGLNTMLGKKECGSFDCSTDWKKYQSKINAETGECLISCSGEGNSLYNYNNKCYRTCPEGT